MTSPGDRAFAAATAACPFVNHGAVRRILAAAAPHLAAAGADGAHRYLSTSCLHGEHAYCQATTGSSARASWAKTPAACKFCEAPCVCPCHREEVPGD